MPSVKHCSVAPSIASLFHQSKLASRIKKVVYSGPVVRIYKYIYKSFTIFTCAARRRLPFSPLPLYLLHFLFPSQAADGEREELQVGEMDLLERNIKKAETEEEKARKEDEEVGERKTKTQDQDQEPQQQGQGLSLSLANGSASRYLAS